MLNSLYIFILRLNNKTVTDSNYFLAIAEFAVTLIVVGVIRNT